VAFAVFFSIRFWHGSLDGRTIGVCCVEAIAQKHVADHNDSQCAKHKGQNVPSTIGVT
jgi:hypothetical protein